MLIPKSPSGLFDAPVRDMVNALNFSGQSIGASGLLVSVIACILHKGAPLPADDKKAARLVNAHITKYRRILDECLSDGCLVRLPTGEIWAPIVAKFRPHRRGRPPRSDRAPINAATREAVLTKTSGKCVYCAVVLVVGSGCQASFEVDHVLPVVLGGSDDIANLVPACRRCNQSKRARTALVFLSGKEAQHG